MLIKHYLSWKGIEMSFTVCNNVFQANIKDVHRASTELQKSKPVLLVDSVDDGQPATEHNVQSSDDNDSAQRNTLQLRDMVKVCNIVINYAILCEYNIKIA